MRTLKDVYMCNVNSISELMYQYMYNVHLNLVKPYHVRESIDIDIIGTVYHLVIYMQSNKIHEVF